jgi:hypothetical protein
LTNLDGLQGLMDFSFQVNFEVPLCELGKLGVANTTGHSSFISPREHRKAVKVGSFHTIGLFEVKFNSDN